MSLFNKEWHLSNKNTNKNIGDYYPGYRQHKRLNNSAEISHQPTRQQEKLRRRFKSNKQAQRFLLIHGQIRNLFGAHRYKMAANDQREHLTSSWIQWQEIAMQAKCP